jgi:hypothetical protein
LFSARFNLSLLESHDSIEHLIMLPFVLRLYEYSNARPLLIDSYTMNSTSNELSHVTNWILLLIDCLVFLFFSNFHNSSHLSLYCPRQMFSLSQKCSISQEILHWFGRFYVLFSSTILSNNQTFAHTVWFIRYKSFDRIGHAMRYGNLRSNSSFLILFSDLNLFLF